MKRSEILDEAKRCICGDRQRDYGDPSDNFALIARLWTAYLRQGGAQCAAYKADTGKCAHFKNQVRFSYEQLNGEVEGDPV